jgi:hypothetical protein
MICGYSLKVTIMMAILVCILRVCNYWSLKFFNDFLEVYNPLINYLHPKGFTTTLCSSFVTIFCPSLQLCVQLWFVSQGSRCEWMWWCCAWFFFNGKKWWYTQRLYHNNMNLLPWTKQRSHGKKKVQWKIVEF